MTQINVKISEALHKALRIKAIEEGVSMAEGVIQGIEWYVSEEETKKGYGMPSIEGEEK